ncbi:citrate lyase holo-[acyl-carrier protein] synthase [Rubrivivax gelatinosus]|uniref:citrate lyase holo-[acyl-carrier protein] synthase n=2 Tax=Rubrivivax gelatinosus TaxID=28068 RepID=A0A4R2MJG8_RUBGE|nr:citrate lyase holo-[acyl-carrier protein] synthase [Rubrivivax gelatinosus]MBK1687969.1 citrate lyase holo-[acyl-carrier protein] synthase [Rubrivivax gelatinosus]TCO99252.1 holo-ACP synthase [Rubrivivax gelatinosus]
MDGSHTPVPVTLEQMLAAREERVRSQQAALAAHGLPLLSLTLVAPGPVKDSAALREVFCVALARLEALCRERGWRVAACRAWRQVTGCEALLAIDADAVQLKRAAVALEDTHALGRLWDLDVLGLDGRSLSRTALGLAPRRCLVCDEAAHACARSRAHPLEQLQAAIARLLENHRHAAVC